MSSKKECLLFESKVLTFKYQIKLKFFIKQLVDVLVRNYFIKSFQIFFI